MATEIDIPVSVRGEKEDAEFSSEFSEGKVTEHPGNRVKQLETRLNQAVETSSRVPETVNTQLESDKQTDEGGIFFQALSVPVDIAAEHIKTPDSCETTTTEDQEDGSGASKIETFMEEKPNDDERVAVKETDDKSVDAQEANEESENGARDKSDQKPVEIEQEEQTEVISPIVEIDEKIEQKDDQEEATESDDGRKEKSDITTVKEVCEEAASEKVESEKEVELSDISSMKPEEKATTILNKDDDQENEHVVNMSEKSQDEDNIKPELIETKEITEKDTQEIEYNATTPTESEERTPKNEEKNDEAVSGSDDDQTKKVESEEVSNLPDVSSMVSNENVIASKEDQDKLYVSEGDGDAVTSSQNASTEFIKETTTSQHATTPAYFEEGQDLNVTPKDILKEEEEEKDDRTTHPQEESEQCENEAEDKREQKQEESVHEIVHSSLEIKQENDTEEIKPSDEKLGHVITAEASNSAQTEPHVESAEREVHNEEATTESDEGVKLSDNSIMKQNEEPVEILSKNEGQETERELNSSEKDQGEDDATCKETVPDKANECEEGLIHSDSSSKVLNENEIVSKDEYQEKEQEFYMSEKGQHGGDDVTSSQNASSEDIKEMIDQHATKVAYFEEVQGLNAMANDGEATDRMIVPQEASEQNENEAKDKREQKPEEIMHSGLETEQEEYVKEIKPSVETRVKEEQEGLVGISSQTEIQVVSQLEATEHEEEAIERDDGPKEKFNNPSIKEVCEEIDAGKVEYEGVQLSDDSIEKLNEKAIAILSKDEDRETEQELKIEEDQHEDGVPSSQDATSVEDLQAKSYDGEGQEPEVVETREGIEEDNEEIKPSVERKEKVDQEGLLDATTTDVCIITQRKSQEEAIEGNDDQREKSDDALVEEVCKEVGTEKVEPEEGIKLSDSSNIELNEKAIAISSKDEDQENEQELSMQEETQGEEGVTCSQEASSEKELEGKNYHGEHIESKLVENGDGIKEDIEVTSANVDTEEIKEQQGSSLFGIVSDVCMPAQTEPKEETTKDEEPLQSYDDREEKLVIPCVNEACEETGLKSIDVQEASEQYENEAKNEREQDLEGSANKPVEIGEATIKEDETTAEDKEEAYFEKSKPEAGDEIECKTAGETQNISAENKDDAIADESSSTENPCTAKQEILEEVGEKTTVKPEEITKQASQESQFETTKEIEDKLDVEEYQVGGREDRSEMKDETVLIENVSTELGQPMAQNVEENQACLTTMNEKIEDEIAKKDEDLSLGSIEVSDDNAVKEEKSFLDGKTREIEISTLEHEPVEEKTTTKSEEITKQDFQESQSEINKEIEAKLDAENQAEGGEDESEMTDEVVLTEKMSSELGQPMEQNVEEIQACGTTTTSEKIEDEIAEKIEDLSLGSIEDKNDNDIKEESFLDRGTREIEISALEHVPVGENTTMEPEDITKQVIQESQIETNKEMEAKLDAEYQADEREDKSETKDDVVLTKEMSPELGQLVEQKAEEIEACPTTTMIDKIEDEIAEKNEDLSHGSIENKDDNIVIEEKSFLDGNTREIETTTLEHEPVEEKTTTVSEEITKQAFQESEIETNKEIDTKLDAENQTDEKEDRREMKDEIVLAEKLSSELGQPMEQNVEEIQACQTTTMNEKIGDEIPKEEEDLSQGNIEVSNDNPIKEEESFPNGGTREIEISTFEHEPVDEKTTIKPEEITKQAFQESPSETKEIEAKLDVENQVDESEDRSEMNDEVVLAEKLSLDLEQPMEENVEEIHSCQTTTMSGKIQDEITEKNEDLSLGNIEDKDDNIVKEEKSFLGEKTKEIEISTLEHVPVGEKATVEPEDITKQAFQESEIETNKEIEAELDVGYQAGKRQDRNEIEDEDVLTKKISSELEQPTEQNVEEIRACQTTTMNEKVEDEITKKDEDLSLGNIEVSDDNTIKEEESFLDERTKEIEISATIKPEEISEHASPESQSETIKEIDAKLDAKNEVDEREDKSEMKDETSLELEQPMEDNVEEMHSCQTTTVSGNIEDEITEKNEDLSLGSIEDKDDNIVKEEKSFLDEKTREIEISTLEHLQVGEKTTMEPEDITKQDFQESEIETNKEIEAELDAEYQAHGREDGRGMKDEMSLELGQPMEQNVEEIQACQTTIMSEKIEDDIVEKNEDLSLGNREDKDDNTDKEEKSFLDENAGEIEISALENEPVVKLEEITEQAFQESQVQTNKEIEANLDAENQVGEGEERREIKDEVVLTKKLSSELGQPMEQNVEEILAFQTTTMNEKIEDEIAKKEEDLSQDNIEVSNGNPIKEEESFLDGRTREIEISTAEHEPVDEKTTIKLEEITEQAFQESHSETNKEIEAKLDAENQADGREDRTEMNDEVVLAEKISSELGKPMEQNIEEIQACQTTTITEKTEDEIVKNEDLSHDSIKDANESIANEEKSVLDGKTREIELSTSEHEPVEEKNGGLDEVPKKKDTYLNEATAVELQEDSIPSTSPGTSTEDTPNSENSKAESENLPIEDLDSVSEAQIPRVVPNSEDSNINEKCRISATTAAVDEERETITKETPSDEISYSDPILVENPEVIKAIVDAQIEVADSEESKVKEECIDLATAEYADENNGDEEQETKTNEISSVEKKEQTTESKQVVELHSVLCPDAVLTEENLELHGELKPTSELMIDEDQVDETKPQPEQSDITSEQQVVVETEKEEGSTEVKQQDFEEDNCPKELEKESTSNQKELANEIEVSKSIPIGNTEVAEIESIDTPSNDQDEQKGVLSSQLTDREILEEEATKNRKEAPNHEFEKDEKDDGLISEIQTPEANLKMEIKEEHLEATNDSNETVTGGLSSEKLLDEVKEIDAKEDTEIIVRQEEEVVADSYQDAVAEVTAHDHLSQTEEKLVSMVPPEELTSSPTAEDQTTELVSETDETKVEHSKDWNPELIEENITNTLSEDQRSVKEQYIEEEGKDNVGAESKEAKSGNEVVEDVVLNEVLLEVEKAKEESDNINKEGSFIPNQLTSATDEVYQIKSLDSSPNELLEQDKEVKSEEISGHGDVHKLEEEPTEVFELTPEVDEMVGEGKEVSRTLTENLPEGSPEMLLVKQDPETTTTIEKSEEEIKDKDETLVNMDSSTSTKQDGLIDMLNKKTEAVQPQEHISDTKSVDPPSDVEIREQGELLKEPSEDNTLPSQNDEKITDLLVIPSVSNETIQCVDKPLEEAPAIDDQKHENDLDYTANARVVDVVSKAESPEIEQQHLDTKEAKVEAINQENIESEIPIEKVPKPTAAHEETTNELLVMPVATEEEKPNYLQDYSKEEEHSGKRTYQDLEAVTEPSQTDKLSDEVKKAESIDTLEETKAEGKLYEEKTGKRTKITEATVDLHHEEKGDETNCKATSMEAAIPIEHVKSSDMVKGESVPKCASTRNPEVRSAILEVLSVMDATDDKPGYNKDPSDKTAEAHVAEKEVLDEDVHLESTSDISKTTEKISGTNQEPFNLPLTKERSMQLDAPVTPGTVKDDLKTSQIQPELQKDEVSARAVDKQLPEKPYQDESTESKLLTGKIDAPHEQVEPAAKSLNAKAKDLEADTEPQCSSEVAKEEKKTSDEKEKPETPETPTQGNSKVAEDLIEERELDLTKDEQVDKEKTGDKGAKTDEEDEAEEDDEDNQKTGGAPVMIEASKDMEVKTPKKSHNILSGVGSKVKHSIAKVKKAITGKSSSPKPPSPKARD